MARSDCLASWSKSAPFPALLFEKLYLIIRTPSETSLHEEEECNRPLEDESSCTKVVAVVIAPIRGMLYPPLQAWEDRGFETR
jgi:hypothetical protein